MLPYGRCCGILSKDRSRYLLTGERPPPLWTRMMIYLIIPALFIALMKIFAVEEEVSGGEEGKDQIVKVPPGYLLWSFIIYVIFVLAFNRQKSREMRQELIKKLYNERLEESGAEADAVEIQQFLNSTHFDTARAHSCCSCLYTRDDTGVVHQLDNAVEDARETEEDFCTKLWGCLANTFWGCSGCWCQCCGCCALAQEEREVNRLYPEQQQMDYLTVSGTAFAVMFFKQRVPFMTLSYHPANSFNLLPSTIQQSRTSSKNKPGTR